MCSVSVMPVFNHLCEVRCWMVNTVNLTVYLTFQVLCLPLDSLLLILKRNLRDFVQNLTDSEWKVSETCLLASLKREKEIWKVMQGNGSTSILGVFKRKKLKGFSLSWRTPNCILLHRYWWNTRIFPFTKKSYLIARSEMLFFSFTCEDIGVALVTNTTSQSQKSFLL